MMAVYIKLTYFTGYRASISTPPSVSSSWWGGMSANEAALRAALAREEAEWEGGARASTMHEEL